MIRKIFFWMHLSLGVTAGVFIFIMAATGVVLSFERQIVEFMDRDIRTVSVPQDAPPQGINALLATVRRAGMGEPTGITVLNQPKAAIQFAIGRGKTVYVDPFSGAILGPSSARARDFFFAVERLHRTLGAPVGSKSAGHWLAAISNLLFGALILFGLALWLPRKWSGKAIRAVIAFRGGLRGKAREWNWHNVIGIWCALPLLVIALTGVVMSFDWANALLFRLSGSPAPASGRNQGDRPQPRRESRSGVEPNYEYVLITAKGLNQDWRTITLNVVRNSNAPVSVVVDTGAGGQPQMRTQYLLNGKTAVIAGTRTFMDGSLGQRLRGFVRFGHTGEYFGWVGQAIAALASLGACVLVYTGISLSIRRLTARLKRARGTFSSDKAIDRNLVTENSMYIDS